MMLVDGGKQIWMLSGCARPIEVGDICLPAGGKLEASHPTVLRGNHFRLIRLRANFTAEIVDGRLAMGCYSPEGGIAGLLPPSSPGAIRTGVGLGRYDEAHRVGGYF